MTELCESPFEASALQAKADVGAKIHLVVMGLAPLFGREPPRVNQQPGNEQNAP